MDDEKTYREWQRETLIEIKDQTKKTNGRVDALERWQSYVLGFCACIVLIILPILFMLIKSKV